jgi:hypothetical protein
MLRFSVSGVMYLYQFTKVWQHFYELKTKRSKGFKNTKWLRHFVFWYNHGFFAEVLIKPKRDLRRKAPQIPFGF